MVTINGIEMGAGIPKICVPIIEKEENNIISEAERIGKKKCEVVEWRIDFFEEVFDEEKLIRTLKKVRETIGEEKLLLVTFRTAKEGGQKDITPEAYERLTGCVIDSGIAHILDVELLMGEQIFKRLIARAKQAGVYVIASNHDFEGTPSKDEIVERLCRMYELGADISKIAVMPQNMSDVNTLLAATAQMKEEHGDITIVTMSMGKLGVISRVAGEIFGSAMTFGIIDKPSAPGQVQIDKLRDIMTELHEL